MDKICCFYCESAKPAGGGTCCHIANLRVEHIAQAEQRMFHQAKTNKEGWPHLMAAINASAAVSVVKHAA